MLKLIKKKNESMLDLIVLHKIFYKNLFFDIDSSNIKLYKIFK